ncbi:MAG: hypothetical protein GY816_04930 [Cytophagales bacterium]|nr:hypothetical protein [Cytophagales bacterium]
MFRILKSKEQFIMWVLTVGSEVDSYLNVFVNQWNSMGIKGMFLKGKDDIEELVEVGFKAEFEEQMYFWDFENEKDAMAFFRDLYLDKNPSENELRKVFSDLGYQQGGNVYRVEWSLGFLLAAKD